MTKSSKTPRTDNHYLEKGPYGISLRFAKSWADYDHTKKLELENVELQHRYDGALGSIREHQQMVAELRRQLEEEKSLLQHYRQVAKTGLYPEKTHSEIATMVRMLLRTDLNFEPVVEAARDRIIYLADREHAEQIRADSAEAAARELWEVLDQVCKYGNGEMSYLLREKHRAKFGSQK